MLYKLEEILKWNKNNNEYTSPDGKVRIKIGFGLKFGNNVKVSNGVIIGNRVILGNNITLNDNVELGSKVEIGDNVIINKGIKLNKRLKIDKNIHLIYNPISIKGSKHLITYIKEENQIQIGCVKLSAKEWKKNKDEITSKYKYSKEQINEYLKYINEIEQT